MISSADTVLFAAGAGAGSGAERKLTMDRDGAIKLLDAAVQVDARRYAIISSVGAEDRPTDDSVFSVYLRAKAEADAAVMASELEWTVLRPAHSRTTPAVVESGCPPSRTRSGHAR